MARRKWRLDTKYQEINNFCRQCSINLFGVDFADFQGWMFHQDAFGDILVPCQGCGWTLVDPYGTCLLAHKEHKQMKLGDRDYIEQAPEIIERFFGVEERLLYEASLESTTETEATYDESSGDDSADTEAE